MTFLVAYFLLGDTEAVDAQDTGIADLPSGRSHMLCKVTNCSQVACTLISFPFVVK